jgi:chemotaxis protein CheZ
VAGDIPDARKRLTYAAEMSEKSAQRILNANKISIPFQEQIFNESNQQLKEIELLLQQSANLNEYRGLLIRNVKFLNTFSKHGKNTKAQLMKIMMVQDF